MMAPRQRQMWLFLLCAGVLLSAGCGWGYAIAYSRFYSVAAVVDRETVDLEFNSRLLHYAAAGQPESVRARLFQRLCEQVRYVDQIIASSGDPDMARDAALSLEHARAALSHPRKVATVARQNPPSVTVH